MSAQWWRDLSDWLRPSVADLKQERTTNKRLRAEKIALEHENGNLRRQLTAASGARVARVGPTGMAESVPVGASPKPVRPYHPRGHEKRGTVARMRTDGKPTPTWEQVYATVTGEGKP